MKIISFYNQINPLNRCEPYKFNMNRLFHLVYETVYLSNSTLKEVNSTKIVRINRAFYASLYNEV